MSSLLKRYTRAPALFSAEIAGFLCTLLNALSSWASGLTVNRMSSFMLAGIVTSKLVKSLLLVFHAALSAGIQAFSWEKAGETDSDSQTPCVAEQQDHHNNPHLQYPSPKWETLASANASRLLTKKDPTRKCPRENVWLVPWRFHIMKS